jgi:hypothetical protein
VAPQPPTIGAVQAFWTKPLPTNPESGDPQAVVDLSMKSGARSLVFGLACAIVVCLLGYWIVSSFAPCAGQCRAPFIFSVDFPPGTTQSEISSSMTKCSTKSGVLAVRSSVGQMFGPHYELADRDATTVKNLEHCLQASGANGGFPS